ncbi:hypothetical protein EON82_17440 [bacterium]|nr:MAG: hypothetical protein EON82_17440 [bacterium]
MIQVEESLELRGLFGVADATKVLLAVNAAVAGTREILTSDSDVLPIDYDRFKVIRARLEGRWRFRKRSVRARGRRRSKDSRWVKLPLQLRESIDELTASFGELDREMKRRLLVTEKRLKAEQLQRQILVQQRMEAEQKRQAALAFRRRQAEYPNAATRWADADLWCEALLKNVGDIIKTLTLLERSAPSDDQNMFGLACVQADDLAHRLSEDTLAFYEPRDDHYKRLLRVLEEFSLFCGANTRGRAASGILHARANFLLIESARRDEANAARLQNEEARKRHEEALALLKRQAAAAEEHATAARRSASAIEDQTRAIQTVGEEIARPREFVTYKEWHGGTRTLQI